MRKKQIVLIYAILLLISVFGQRSLPLEAREGAFSPFSLFNVRFASDSINYTVEVRPSEERTWILDYLDEVKLELVFGLNWTETFGLPENARIGEKIKINVTSVEVNDTHFLIDYQIWDWVYRLDNFSTAGTNSRSLEHPICPENCSNFEFASMFPLILPASPSSYVYNLNLTNSYYDALDHTSYGGIHYVYYDREVNVSGTLIDLHGIAGYLPNGTLKYFKVGYLNGSSHIDLLSIDTIKPFHLELTSLGCQLNEEFTWLLVNYNQSLTERFLGEDWFENYGLLPDPQRLSSVKMKVANLAENNSHWQIDYSLYNWTKIGGNFPEVPIKTESYFFDKEPFNESRTGEIKIPFIIPTPTNLYLSCGRLGGYAVEHYDFATSLNIHLENNLDWLWGQIFYNEAGVLSSIRFSQTVQVQGVTIEQIAFEIVLCYDTPTPDYVGVFEGEVFNYSIWTNDSLNPYLNSMTINFERMKIEILKVFGEDIASNRTLILANVSLRESAGNWILEDQLIAAHVHRDNKMNFDPLILSNANPFFLAPLFVNNHINWSEFAYDFNNCTVVSTMPQYEVVEASSGYDFIYRSYEKNMTLSYLYNETGYVSEFIIYINDDFYHNCSLGLHKPPPIVVDEVSPDITVLSPITRGMSSNSPYYDVVIQEENLNRTWYSISNGSLEVSEEISFGSGGPIVELTGRLNESLWNLFSDGNLTVRFYANDSAGNSNWKELWLIKDATAPVITILNLVSGELFNDTAPDFELLISELYLNRTWYVVNGSEMVYFTGTSGTIDQTIWETLTNGSVLVQFFALDDAGNLGAIEVVIAKYADVESPPPVDPVDPPVPTVSGSELEFVLLQIIASVAVIAITIGSRKSKRKFSLST